MPARKRKFFLIICLALICLSFVQVKAQTDPKALNPGPEEISNNPLISKHVRCKPYLIARLPGIINETSGLMFINGQLWTINDGGNPPNLFQIDTATGKILQKLTVANAVNTDWESITQDDSSIYIGDFGNNYGNRKDLHILKITKNDLYNHHTDTLTASYIYFSYPDQKDFRSALNKNNFDCEAFFCHNDSLHLFSKDWLDLKTRHYSIPAQPGNYQASYIEQFQEDGLVTDASINEQGNVVLLGYKNTRGRFWNCFCWLLAGYNDGHFFDGKATRVELGSALHLGQSEGIVLTADKTAWISSESIRVGCMVRPAKLFGINLSKYF